jgi:prepilin-type N-terminal cleavage/methylation domain-containing protein
MSRRSDLSRAFTLIEILVVVVILGIASAIIIPQLGSRDDLKATSMSRMLMADLVYAQNRAVATQRTHYVRFDTEAGRYEVLDAILPENLINHPVNKTPFVVNFGPTRKDGLGDVALSAASFDTKTVVAFDELGTPHSYDEDTGVLAPMNAGTMTLQCGTCQVTITIEPYSGELRVN